jgi:hypothetical protein
MTFATHYAAALKYAMESPWESFRKQLESEPELRWGTHEKAAEVRPIAADAYAEETGDEHGAGLLRDPKQHVVIHEGKVKKGRFTLDHISSALNDIGDHFEEHNQHNPTGHVDADPTGQHYLSHELVDPHEYDPDFMEGPGELPEHHVRVVDIGGDHPVHLGDHPWKDVGKALADSVDDEAERATDWHGTTDDSGEEFSDFADEYERLLKNLREAPFEEPVPEKKS